MKTPNIFNYATSELSQDAFILWLLDWANPQNAEFDSALCCIAQDFIRLLLNKKELQISSVKCKKQENHIDVFAIINEKYALIVEDKTNTTEHGNQILRYYEWVNKEKKYSNLDIHCIYYKTGNESAAKLKRLAKKYEEEFKSEHFSIITREKVLALFTNCSTKNAIFTDYVAHIQNIQDKTDAYLTTPVDKWSSQAWQGFYMCLAQELQAGDWGYVANPKGGFWGFWWHWCKTKDPDIEVYLQFEQNKLCIKAYHKGNGKVEIKLSNKVIKAAKERNLPLEDISRRTGKTMTLAVVKLQNFDTLNMPEILVQLKEIEEFIDDVSSKL